MTEEKKTPRTAVYLEDYPSVIEWIETHIDQMDFEHGYRPTKKQAFQAYVAMRANESKEGE